MLIYLPLLVCIVGAFVYLLAANPKTQEMGKLAYFAGLLAFLLQYGPQMVGGGK